jgi:type VI secretion system secreted protein Hcp
MNANRFGFGVAGLVVALLVTGCGGGGAGSAVDGAGGTDSLAGWVGRIVVPANADLLLRVDGVQGEARRVGYENWIDIQSFKWGVTQSGGASGGGGGAGRVDFDELTITKPIDRASPKLFQYCAQGKHIAKVSLVVLQGNQRGGEVYRIDLSDVLITSVTQAVVEGGELPAEALALNFTRIKIVYREQRPDGSLGVPVEAEWDLSTNSAARRIR